jgi:hypothetical protein
MKTTLNIQDALFAEAKALAARQRLSLTRLIEEGLRLRLRLGEQAANRSSRPMPVFGTPSATSGATPIGLASGLSGLSTREMLDLLDDDEAARAA